MAKLAFYTFGIMKPPGQMTKPFVNLATEIPKVFEDAINADGYLQPILGAEADKPLPRFHDAAKHHEALVTLSVWRDLESVYSFSYRGRHVEALRSRHDWFVKGDWPSYVAWWIDDASEPSFDHGVSRLEHLHDKGPTRCAFNFATAFDCIGNQYQIGK